MKKISNNKGKHSLKLIEDNYESFDEVNGLHPYKQKVLNINLLTKQKLVVVFVTFQYHD